MIQEEVIKHPRRAVATRLFNYPFPAAEEAVVNAVSHRSYEQREPVEVRVNPDGIEIVSYPGPGASILGDASNGENIVARRYRNRRIGEFLKEFELTEGRSTGIPKIRAALEKNGSPPPRVSTDEGRTHFPVERPVHPQVSRVEGQDGGRVGFGDLSETERRIMIAVSAAPKSTAQIAVGLGYPARTRNVLDAVWRLLRAGMLELTIPDKPRSKNQKLQVTGRVRRALTQGPGVCEPRPSG